MQPTVLKTAFTVILLISVPGGIAAALLAFFNAAHLSSSLLALSLAGALGVLVTSANMETVADPRPALRELSTPALVIRGECDRMSEEVHREYVDVLPRARLVTLEGVAHNESGSPSYGRRLEAFSRGTELPF